MKGEKMRTWVKIILGLSGLMIAGSLLLAWNVSYSKENVKIVEPDWQRAYRDVEYQVSLGPRIPGSDSHNKTKTWMVSELTKSSWQVEIQEGRILDKPVENIIARRGTGKPWVIIGAHYDSRQVADRDPEIKKRTQPVPGANDGASGVAVLLELGRTLPVDLDRQIWLVFLDAEDQGGLAGWDWILGSRYFVSQLSGKPDAVVIIDMIGDSNLNINFEQSSDRNFSQHIWNLAAQQGFSEKFIPQVKYSVLDDHTPFLQQGISAIDLIDFDYPYWHTTADTPDKISPESLRAVGETLRYWLMH
jgi:glutaminyl-peptide cyclotransferase